MMFEKMVRIPHERVAVLIGRRGAAKSEIERKCGVAIRVDGATGEVLVVSSTATDVSGKQTVPLGGDGDPGADLFAPFKAVEIIMAIGRGFAPDVAMTLLYAENSLHVINLTEYAGKSRSGVERVKGRIIGERGRARRNMEQLSGTKISVYGKTVSIIGAGSNLRRAVDAVSAISEGSMHGAVYNRLENANRRQKQERMILWENGGISDMIRSSDRSGDGEDIYGSN